LRNRRATTSQQVTDTYEYDAYGNELNKTGSTPNSYLYRGEFFDSDLGLYYLRARWMNPLTGRFMSMDPQEHKPIDPLLYQPLKSRKPLDPRKWHRYWHVVWITGGLTIR
jgi:RHS repeat-associated protein